MNEDRRKRGFVHSNFLTAVAISALFLGSGNVMAAQTDTDIFFRSDRAIANANYNRTGGRCKW